MEHVATVAWPTVEYIFARINEAYETLLKQMA
jgi:hypothetical protein